SKKAVVRERARLKEMTSSRMCFKPLPQMIAEVNRQMKGWANYFSFGYPRMTYRAINWYVRWRLTIHMNRRSQRPFKLPEGKSYYRYLKELGLVYLQEPAQLPADA